MFEFVNETYSAAVTVVATLLALAYPLIIGCIDKIDTKYESTEITEEFLNDSTFRNFRVLLIFNLVLAVLFPFLMDNNKHARILIGIQCCACVILVVCMLKLLSIILRYYNLAQKEQDFREKFNQALDGHKENDAAKYFTYWVYTILALFNSLDFKKKDITDEVFKKYVEKKYSESDKDKPLKFDKYFYEGVLRINEFWCQREVNPLSDNLKNSFLTNLLYNDSAVSDTTYRYLWRNLSLQLYYGKEAWWLAYWAHASDYKSLLLQHKSEVKVDEHVNSASADRISFWQEQCKHFREFHIMLCSMLLLQQKYRLLKALLSHTDDMLQTYPLVPSTFREWMEAFLHLNQKCSENPLYIASMYPMTHLQDKEDKQLDHAAMEYFALLVYRLYALNWNCGPRYVLNIGELPADLSQLHRYEEYLAALKRCMLRIEANKELLEVVGISSLEETLREKQEESRTSKGIPAPLALVEQFISQIQSKKKKIKETASLDDDKVKQAKQEVRELISSGLEAYKVFRHSNYKSSKYYSLNASVKMPFPTEASLSTSENAHVGMSSCMAGYMLRRFRFQFAQTFYTESIKHNCPYYQISSEDLFNALDRLELNAKVHCIVAFGMSLANYLTKVNELKPEDERTYYYKDVKIIVLNEVDADFAQQLYVMRLEDLPYMHFHQPDEKEQQAKHLDFSDEQSGLWLSLERVADHDDLMKQMLPEYGEEEAKQQALFTAIWCPQLHFKETYRMMHIQVKYPLKDEGVTQAVSDVKPFDA